MNKDIPVLKANINENNIFTEILEVNNISYAPISIKNAFYDKSKSVVKELNEWFMGRGIPSWRKDLEKLLNNLQVKKPRDLLLKSFGLSLSDCYWIKDENSNLLWKNINHRFV